jgi:putative mRNA 3-end processing factor
MSLIEFTDKGFYCREGNFYIDPWKPVEKALITHAHSDHARWGSNYYLCHTDTKPLLQQRLGNNQYQSVDWNQSIYINGVRVTFYPAGHIIGSSQIKVEAGGQIWVLSGDYKLENDGISGAFEPIRCHNFITESTFGLPIYKWKPQSEIYTDLKNWITKNQAEGKTSILIAYSLGKAQRLLKPISEVTDKIFVHGAVFNIHMALVNAGWKLPFVQRILPDTSKESLKGSVVIAPSSAEGSPWLKRFLPYEIGICSGWMQVRGNVRRKNADAGFALSDHADWSGLLKACRETEAECIYSTHGFQSVFTRYLNEQGVNAKEVKTEFGDDETIDENGPQSSEDETLAS